MKADLRSRLRRLPPPQPTAGVEAYRLERERSLALSAQKRANYELFLKAQRDPQLAYLPVKLDIENVSRCNFHCTMCVVSDWEKGRRAADMPVEAFKRLIDEQIGLVEIKLQGMGEPLLQRDDFFEMIRYARARHIWVRITTNASLLHLNDNHRKLIDADPNEVQISIDGADKQTFEAIRRGAVFEQVVANCKLINAYCRERGVKRTKMWTVLQKANVGQMRQLVELAVEMGFTHNAFSVDLSDWGQAQWRERNEGVNVEDSLDPDEMEELIAYGARLGLDVAFWTVNDRYRVGDRRTLCPWPFERAFVSSDLRVVPCCHIANPDVYQIDGAIAEDGFSRVWHGDTYRAFRQAHIDGDLPEVCKACYAATRR